MALVTTTRARLHPAANALEETLLQALLNAASNQVEAYCNRKFAEDDFTEVSDGCGGRKIMFDNPPVSVLTSVTILDDDGVTTTVLDSTDFRLDGDMGMARLDPESDQSYIPSGYRNVTAVYTGGYDPIPEDVQEAVIQIAVAMAGSRGLSSQDNPAMKSETLGDYSYTRADAGSGDNAVGIFDKPVAQLLAPYRL